MGWDARDYAEHAAFVPALGTAVLELLAPRPGEAILDMGCGDGALTERIAETGASVLGCDIAPGMLAAARTRGLAVEAADGQALPYVGRFDAVFTNASLHWMADQPAAAASVFRALKPGGRYVGECGGFLNIAAIRTAIRAVIARHEFAPAGDGQVYQTPEALTAILEAAGFTDIDARLIPRPTPLPTGLRGWLKTFRAGFLDAAGVPPGDQPAIVDKLETLLAPQLRDDQGRWTADYVRLRWRARKPD